MQYLANTCLGIAALQDALNKKDYFGGRQKQKNCNQVSLNLTLNKKRFGGRSATAGLPPIFIT